MARACTWRPFAHVGSTRPTTQAMGMDVRAAQTRRAWVLWVAGAPHVPHVAIAHVTTLPGSCWGTCRLPWGVCAAATPATSTSSQCLHPTFMRPTATIVATYTHLHVTSTCSWTAAAWPWQHTDVWQQQCRHTSTVQTQLHLRRGSSQCNSTSTGNNRCLRKVPPTNPDVSHRNSTRHMHRLPAFKGAAASTAALNAEPQSWKDAPQAAGAPV